VIARRQFKLSLFAEVGAQKISIKNDQRGDDLNVRSLLMLSSSLSCCFSLPDTRVTNGFKDRYGSAIPSIFGVLFVPRQ
jgi:hypothetical protein